MVQHELSEIFDHFLRDSSLLMNREVLRPDYVPENLPHRDEQIQRLGWTLAPVLQSVRCSNIFVYGKPGTGKTAVTHFVLGHLIRKSDEVHVPVKACYVNCRLVGTDYRVLSSLCDAVHIRVPFTGLATGEVFDRFKQGLTSHGGILVAVLDEVDILVKYHGDNLLYELTRINETSNVGKVVLIGISNDLNFKDLLDPRVLSSLSEEEIVFKPYTADELYDILLERAHASFVKNGFHDSALRLCAALAATEHGDARRALDLLRAAAEIAERERVNIVTEEYVRKAQRKIEQDRVSEVLNSLPLHQRLVLYSIFLLHRANVNNSLTGDIYEVYSELCGEVSVEPLTQRRVSGLINELDTLGVINAKLVSLGRHGRSKKVRLAITPSVASNQLGGDIHLSSLLNYTPNYLHKIV